MYDRWAWRQARYSSFSTAIRNSLCHVPPMSTASRSTPSPYEATTLISRLHGC
jgi:hypothetical protein